MFYGPGTWPSLAAVQNPAAVPCWANGDKPPCTWNMSEIWSNITVTANGGVAGTGAMRPRIRQRLSHGNFHSIS